MVSLLLLLNSNECAAIVMEIFANLRKLVLTQSDTQKTVPLALVISRWILQHNCCSMLFFPCEIKIR